MKELVLPSYQALNQALNKTSLKLHPSEAHGLVCGILSGDPKSSKDWEDLITGGKETPKAHKLLQMLYDASQHQLDDFLFEFQLVLPRDKEALPERAEALTLWCQGFLTGLKIVKIAIVDREPSDVTEAINDIIEIAKMDYEEVIASEEDEKAYLELVEYVRMAVILVYQDIRNANNENKSPSSSTHLH